MAVPTLRVEVAFDDSATETSPAWTTVAAADVLSFTTTQGRQSETDDATQPAVASIVLDNSSRTYDPEYVAGAYFGKLSPARQIRVTAVEGDATETVLFRGVVGPDGWQQAQYQHPASSRCLLSCVDFLGYLTSWSDDLPLFETYLRQLAIDADIWGGSNPGVLHWPLDDSAGETFEGAQTFNQPVDADNPYVTNPSSFGLDGSLGTAVPPALVTSNVILRGNLTGSLDSALGYAQIDINYMPMGSSSAVYHKETSHGFAVKLRGYPTTDRAPLADAVFFGAEAGFWIDRDGTVLVNWSGDPDDDLASPVKLELNQTYFICGTYDRDSMTAVLYIDGVAVATDTAYPSIGGDLGALSLYFGRTDGAGPLANYCDAWAIRATLTAAQVATLEGLWRGFRGLKPGDAAGDLLNVFNIANNCSGGRVGLAEQSAAAAPGALLQSFERTELGRLHYRHAANRVEMVTFADLANGARHQTVQETFSDDPADTTALRFSDPTLAALQPANSVTASNSLRGWTRRDEESIARYGIFSRSIALISDTEFDSLSVAEWLLYLQGEPRTAVTGITVKPTTSAEFKEALGVELFDRAEIKRTPHGIGDQIVTEALIEGRTISVGSGVHDFAFSFFLAEPGDYAAWVWGAGEWRSGTNGLPDRNGARLGP